MAIGTGTAILLAAVASAATQVGLALTAPKPPKLPGVPDDLDPAKTQDELDTDARAERVRAARINQLNQGVGSQLRGSAGLGNPIRTTLPTLTGQ